MLSMRFLIINTLFVKKATFLLFHFVIVLILCSGEQVSASDSIQNQKWNLHFQTTFIDQFHPTFKAPYRGDFSLDNNAENHFSVTATFYLGLKLWKGGSLYFNPEISGGEGFSLTRGVAGFPNGEVYRVSDPSPQVYVGRIWFRQVFSLSKFSVDVGDDLNQLAGKEPDCYISLNAGRFSMMDFFDNNAFSHDPRRQFYNWALMGNGAWDYPANTRGYTYGFVSELVKSTWGIKFGIAMVPTTANGSKMDDQIFRSNSFALEFQKPYHIKKQHGTIRLLTFFTQARMGNYHSAMQWGVDHDTTPDLTSSRELGHTKFGFGLNIEHFITPNIGLFLRTGWNDGRNETWAFTEIDQAISAGISLDGSLWKRNDDQLGISFLANGISSDHRFYLKNGGYGFIIGDGKLSYSPEIIGEVYYSIEFFKPWLWISPDYQLIINPAYNHDRGPVNAFGIRAHIEI